MVARNMQEGSALEAVPAVVLTGRFLHMRGCLQMLDPILDSPLTFICIFTPDPFEREPSSLVSTNSLLLMAATGSIIVVLDAYPP